MNRLLIMDGNSLANRAFYALPPLTDRNGFQTNAIFGFWTMSLRLLAEEKPTHWIVVFDAGKKNFRHDLYTEYKGQREKTPNELSDQFPVMKQILREAGACVIELPGYEADDIIGTLTRESAEQGANSLVITGDKDLLQLVNEKITVALTRKGISELERYTPIEFREKYGLEPIQMIDLKALMGDPSDNIPGVPGIGEKTAQKLLLAYQNIENLIDHVGELKGKQQEQLQSNIELAKLSKTLATIHQQVPLDATWTDGEYHGLDATVLSKWFQQLAFKSLIDRVREVSSSVETSEVIVIDQTSTDESMDIEWIDFADAKSLSAFEAALSSLSVFMIDSHGDNPHHAEVNVMYWSDGHKTWIANGHDGLQLLQRDAVKAWASDDSITKKTHDLHRLLVILSRYDVMLTGVTFDSLLVSYLLDPTRSGSEVADLLELDVENKPTLPSVQSDEKIYGKGAKFQVPARELLGAHLAKKAQVVTALHESFIGRLEKEFMHQLYFDLELPLTQVLALLERTGVRVNQEDLMRIGKEFHIKIDDLVTRIYAAAGCTFNINSTKQLGEVLFEKLQLPPVKKTKTGYSTDAEVLEKLAPYHEVVGLLLEYRTLAKLQSTYVEGLQHEIHADTGSVHTYYNQTLTATGRLSSQFPNLQNIPVRIEEGRQLRRVFVPRQSEQGWRMLAADYSQIELRVLAHISGDVSLIEAFKLDRDIHTQTAATVFGVIPELVDANMRRQAKAVNFGIVYGMSDFGLSQNLNITRKAAGQFIEQYFAAFPGVKKYMEDVVGKARQDGYVTTLLNRRRYLPDIRSSNFNARSFAERMAMNTPIQGSAADLIKLAMVRLADWMKSEQLKSRMLLQVHDELVFEVAPDELELMYKHVREHMESAYLLDVPLKVDIHDGANWYETK